MAEAGMVQASVEMVPAVMVEINPVAADPPNPDEKKTPEKIRYRGGRFSFFLSLEKPSSFSIPVSGSFSPLYLGNKENIVYIIIKTCIRRDDACRSTVLYKPRNLYISPTKSLYRPNKVFL